MATRKKCSLNCVKSQTGFTLIELMVTLIIVGILTSIAVPSFNSVILNQRTTTAATDIYSSLVYARSEAIKRRASVTVVPGTSWGNGWDVKIASSSTILKTQNPPASTLTFTDSAGSPATTITFTSTGRPTASKTISVYATGNSNIPMRCISLDLSGRPNIKIDTNTNTGDGC